jgi:pimeloyl-ACP methyl ester carboxylesterase
MELAHERRGRGPTVVVLCQLEKPLWDPVLERLAAEREVVAVDLPGTGDSRPLPEREVPTVEALARAVADWMRAVRLDRPHVAGNSLGGAIAIELVRAAAVRGAIAISPVGLWTRAEATYALRSLRMARVVSRALGSRAGVVAGSPLGRTLAFGQLMSRPRRLSRAVAADMLRGLATAPGFERTVPAVAAYRMPAMEPDVPVTVAWGRRDLLTPPHQARRAQQRVPAARHVTLPGCGHSPMSDDPDRIARLILEASRA